MPVARPVVAALLASLVLSACSEADTPLVETAVVRSAEVVQTVSAPAQIEAAATASVRAPFGGEVERMWVADGDRVAAGDPLVLLGSDVLTEQLEQAEALATSADRLGAASGAAVPDLGPVLGAFRGQIDTLFPALLASFGSQLDTVEAALDAAVVGVDETIRATEELTDGIRTSLEELREALGSLPGDVVVVPDLPVAPGDLEVPDGTAVTASLDAARRSVHQARQELTATERAVSSASLQLRNAERDLQAQTQGAAAAQAAAVTAQAEQAELAVEAARARLDDLEVVAPIGGVVEFARGGGSGTGSLGAAELAGELGDLGDLGDLGSLSGGMAGGGLSSLLGGASGAVATGPIAVGAEVGAGQELLTVLDLSSFVARVEVDELDVVHVTEGQPVRVRVDAFPGVELDGIVDHVALTPSRDVIGGALYPVTVRLTRVPEEVNLRVGLTASAEIEVRRVQGDTVVPTSALLRRGDDGEVIHVVRDGRAVEVPVRVVAIGDADAAVEGDLRAGERVVTVGVELISDGDEVPS